MRPRLLLLLFEVWRIDLFIAWLSIKKIFLRLSKIVKHKYKKMRSEENYLLHSQKAIKINLFLIVESFFLTPTAIHKQFTMLFQLAMFLFWNLIKDLLIISIIFLLVVVVVANYQWKCFKYFKEVDLSCLRISLSN